MEFWTDPEVVARFRPRIKLYWFVSGIVWLLCFPLMIGAFSDMMLGVKLFDTPWVRYFAAFIGIIFIGMFLTSTFWRCPHCKAALGPRDVPTKYIWCTECGAVLYEPSGRYDPPSRPRKPAPGARIVVNAMTQAEVYLAHGRKSQAIEVLEEALRGEPHRADIAGKLAELKQPAGRR